MTDEDTPKSAEQILTHFPPIPLLSGNTVRSADGDLHTLATVTVRMVGEDGAVVDVDLEYRFGGWWPPSPVSPA